MRYQIFSDKGDEINSTCLPPCEDTSQCPSVREKDQVAVWKHCLQSMSVIPSLVGHGWINDKVGSLTVIWMTIKPALDDILRFVACSCVKL